MEIIFIFIFLIAERFECNDPYDLQFSCTFQNVLNHIVNTSGLQLLSL